LGPASLALFLLLVVRCRRGISPAAALVSGPVVVVVAGVAAYLF
jgi:hypothetical protein